MRQRKIIKESLDTPRRNLHDLDEVMRVINFGFRVLNLDTIEINGIKS